MRLNSARSGIVLPGVAAGVIYFVIALATAAPLAPSVIGGVVVATVAVLIGMLIRAAYTRRGASRHR
jgi:hypothetical protein